MGDVVRREPIERGPFQKDKKSIFQKARMATTVQVGQPMQPGMGAPQQFTVVTGPPRPNNYLGLSIFACICCNWITGGIAIWMASQSSTAADNGDMETARQKGKWALGCSLFSIISTILITAVLVILLVVVGINTHNDIMDSISSGSWDWSSP